MSGTIGAALRGAVSGEHHLDSGQYLAAWRRLGLGDKPLTLDVVDHGATIGERDAADARALERLRADGLAGSDGTVADALADALAVLARPRTELYARVWAGGPRRAHLACARGATGVVAGLDERNGLRIRLVEPDEMVGGLLDVLPAAAPLPGSPMTVPAHAVQGAGPDLGRRLRRAGLPPAVAQRCERLWTQQPERLMQCGAARRDDGRRRRADRTVAVVDVPDGRAIVAREGAHVTVRPADRAVLHAALAAVLAALDDPPRPAASAR